MKTWKETITMQSKRHSSRQEATALWQATLTACMLLTTLLSVVRAQDVSLYADDTDDVIVTIKNRPVAITVIRDANSPSQWYYVPRAPRLSETLDNGQTEPVFHLYRYKFADPNKTEAAVEGGVLQFAVNFSIPEEALGQLRAYLSAKMHTPEPQINLSALKIKKSEVNVYIPERSGQGNQGIFLAAPLEGNGIAPQFATQEMAFSVPLTRLGTNLLDAMMEGKDGVKVQILFTYGGLTPPAGFKVTVDYRQAQSHYSRNSRFRAEASYYGLWGASYESQSQYIRDQLIDSGALKVEIQEGSGFKLEDIDKYLQPIVKRINDQILETMKTPNKIEPTHASGNDKGGFFGSANYSVAVKDVSQVRELKESIDFQFRHYEERTTVAAGFLSVGGYPEEVRKRLVTAVPELDWSSSFFMLPTVGDKPELGIEAIALTASIEAGDKHVPDQTVIWRPGEGWRRLEEKRSALFFSLLAHGITADQLKSARYQIKMTITARGEILEIMQSDAVFDGERAITSPTTGVDVVEIDGSDLTWHKLDVTSSLDRVLITLASGGRQTRYAMKPRSVNGQFTLPNSFYWLIKRDAAEPAMARIQFELHDGTLIDWVGNGNLRERYPSLSIALKDTMWRRP
jgi:hypothetical protein